MADPWDKLADTLKKNDAFAVDAIFHPASGDPIPGLRVFLDLEIKDQVEGFSTQVGGPGSQIEYYLPDIGREAVAGESFEIVDAATYTVKAVNENDGVYVKLIVIKAT